MTAAGSDAGARYLLVPLGSADCAIPVEHVVEILRPLPVEKVPGSPAVVAGIAVVRGTPIPVLDFRRLLGAEPRTPSRFVVVRTGGRRVALAVDGVSGIERIPAEVLTAAPPLLSRAASDGLEAVSSLDGALVLVLRTAKLVPEAVAGVPA
jgi:purine-binding chemotaxis protein CheW